MINNTVKLSLGAMVLGFGIGSAIAAEPAGNMSIMPQHVQPMVAAELDSVRGMWADKMPGPSQAAVKNPHFVGGDCPPGILKNGGYSRHLVGAPI